MCNVHMRREAEDKIIVITSNKSGLFWSRSIPDPQLFNCTAGRSCCLLLLESIHLSDLDCIFLKKRKEEKRKEKYHRLQSTPRIFVVAVGELYSCGGAGEKYYHLPSCRLLGFVFDHLRTRLQSRRNTSCTGNDPEIQNENTDMDVNMPTGAL